MVIHLAGLGLVTQAPGKMTEHLATGVYAPLPSSIGPVRYISELSPATYVLRGVRSAVIDGTGPDRGYVAILVVMACLFIPVGLWGFGRAERYAKRTGKLKRVG
jgi:ABC-2 type transport system permease protein